MPTIASGSGALSADIYYEVRGDTPSTSDRYLKTTELDCHHNDNNFLPNWFLREPENPIEVNILMIMGELACLFHPMSKLRCFHSNIFHHWHMTMRTASGFGATLDCWEPQLDGLLRPEVIPRCIVFCNFVGIIVVLHSVLISRSIPFI